MAAHVYKLACFRTYGTYRRTSSLGAASRAIPHTHIETYPGRTILCLTNRTTPFFNHKISARIVASFCACTDQCLFYDAQDAQDTHQVWELLRVRWPGRTPPNNSERNQEMENQMKDRQHQSQQSSFLPVTQLAMKDRMGWWKDTPTGRRSSQTLALQRGK